MINGESVKNKKDEEIEKEMVDFLSKNSDSKNSEQPYEPEEQFEAIRKLVEFFKYINKKISFYMKVVFALILIAAFAIIAFLTVVVFFTK